MEKPSRTKIDQDQPEDLQALLFKYLQLHDQMRLERLAFAKLFKQHQDAQETALQHIDNQQQRLSALKKQLLENCQSAAITAAEEAYPEIARQLNTTLSETLTPTVADLKTHLKHFAYYLQQLQNDRQQVNWQAWIGAIVISVLCSMLCTSFAVRHAMSAYEQAISHDYRLGQAVTQRLRTLPPKERQQALQLLKLRREETPT